MALDFGRKNLVLYITAGYPSLSFTQKAVLSFQEWGATAIEIGIPYSDPVADGPVIQQASLLSLEKGTNLDNITGALSEIKKDVRVPLYAMSYYSPIFSYGMDKFIARSLDSGIAGSIIPDLELDEGRGFFTKQKENGLDPILLAFPNTPDTRVRQIADEGGSFIYYVNIFGTTGVGAGIPESSIARMAGVRSAAGKPVFAGFGVSGPADASRLLSKADGVIVGSAVVKRILDNAGDEKAALMALEVFIKEMAGIL